MGQSRAGDDRVPGGDVVNDVAVIPVEDRARQPLARGLGCGSGGVGGGSVEVEEIGGVNVVGSAGSVVVAVVVVGVVRSKKSVVEPIGRGLERVLVVLGIGAGLSGRVRQYRTQGVIS